MGIPNRGAISDVVISASLQGAAPVTAANYGQFFIANQRYKVKKIQEVHRTASSTGTVTVERLQGTEAKTQGDALLTSALSTAGAAETVQAGTLVTTGVTVLEIGDRLGLSNGGTLTSSADLLVQVTLTPIQ